MDSEKGMLLRIERSSVVDGSGFRTVIFLKGCPLRCIWCSTPESQSLAVEQAEDKTYGRLVTVEDIMKEIRKDSCCYFTSGGGVTLSGGEIFAQPKFLKALLHTIHDECYNTAVETSLYTPWETAKAALLYIDTAFVDLKIFDDELHKKYTGISNRTILSNLKNTNELKGSFRLIIRIPIIPGINDSEENLEDSGRFCSGLKHLDHVQLLPYHRLGTETYKRLDREYALADVKTPSAEHMSMCREIIGKFVPNVK